MLSLAAPSLKLSPECSTFADEYPFSVKVEGGGLSVADVVSMHRDHYEGTLFDLTRGYVALSSISDELSFRLQTELGLLRGLSAIRQDLTPPETQQFSLKKAAQTTLSG